MAVVYVGLSGGVDSAVAASLLKNQGHTVIGVFIKIWQPEFIECTWREDRLDAMRVAVSLGIPFRELDLSDTYRDEVIRDMLESYTRGETPNPDILCNQVIKFGAFAAWALSDGAEYVATGHYAQNLTLNGRHELCRGRDPDKDQSYFLARLKAYHLATALFPVGGLTKKEVRAYADAQNLPVAKKKDSQGLCFVGAISLPDFLSRYIPPRPGNVLDESGQVIGHHDGVTSFTLGQRHGFTHSAIVPLYVSRIDVSQNTITVSPQKKSDARATYALRDVQWVHDAPTLPYSVQVQTRYRDRVHEALISNSSDMTITLTESIVVAAGQTMVFYCENRVIGCGIVSHDLM